MISIVTVASLLLQIDSWGSFKEGSWVKGSTTYKGKTGTETRTLEKVTPTTFTIKIDSPNLTKLPGEPDREVNSINCSRGIVDAVPARVTLVEEKKLGTEEMTVGPKKISCTVYELRHTSFGSKVIDKTKVWVSDLVPGKMVRVEGSTTDDLLGDLNFSGSLLSLDESVVIKDKKVPCAHFRYKVEGPRPYTRDLYLNDSIPGAWARQVYTHRGNEGSSEWMTVDFEAKR